MRKEHRFINSLANYGPLNAYKCKNDKTISRFDCYKEEFFL